MAQDVEEKEGRKNKKKNSLCRCGIAHLMSSRLDGDT